MTIVYMLKCPKTNQVKYVGVRVEPHGHLTT